MSIDLLIEVWYTVSNNAGCKFGGLTKSPRRFVRPTPSCPALVLLILVVLLFAQAVGLPDIPCLPKGSTMYILYAYIVFAFAIGAPKLYLHMIQQRKKQLQAGGGKVKAS